MHRATIKEASAARIVIDLDLKEAPPRSAGAVSLIDAREDAPIFALCIWLRQTKRRRDATATRRLGRRRYSAHPSRLGHLATKKTASKWRPKSRSITLHARSLALNERS
jgi:hypothetical protein